MSDLGNGITGIGGFVEEGTRAREGTADFGFVTGIGEGAELREIGGATAEGMDAAAEDDDNDDTDDDVVVVAVNN